MRSIYEEAEALDRLFIKTLEQAQKQEKLLKLYKELITIKDDVIRSVFFDTDYEYLSVKIEKIENQIKELENE